MIVNMCIYTTRPGKLAAFVMLYKDHAWDLQQKYLGRCLGWYTTVEGSLNQVVHFWAYDSQDDCEAKREAMAANPAWGEYLRHSKKAGLLLAQENRTLKPANFSLH